MRPEQTKLIEALQQFTKVSLFEASTKFLNTLHLTVSQETAESIPYSVFYTRKLPNDRIMPAYVSDIMEDIAGSFFIGPINGRIDTPDDLSTSFESYIRELNRDGRYQQLIVFACDAKPGVKFSRHILSRLTRAYNVISTNSPVILIVREGNCISLSTCDRLGEREKIGRVTSLVDINCQKPHPGHLQILEGAKLCSSYDELYASWKKSFSVDVISDLFFVDYRKQYWKIIKYITGKGEGDNEATDGTPCMEIMSSFNRFPQPEKTVRDYVKKLMGRLVFIQFLQKKKWMGCPSGDDWGNGDEAFLQHLFASSSYKDSFVDNVLEPLFNDINTKREGDLTSNPEIFGDIKVPYLNGGLFEPDECDDLSFPIKGKLIEDLLAFFDSYNFTIDESAPYDAEISVDPEMLGRIFENLLEDNKDKGAFYTPKEIVQYMCREALVAYLQNDIEDEGQKESIRNFVTTHDIQELQSSLVYTIDQKLRNVKICDPAIGSGAFPMGMLRELYDCRYAIRGEEGDTPSQIKKDIIQNSIYGVDIEKGAVDIARLRFWLSLIIEENSPHTLPNMDFKIMQGDSLLEQYEGVNLCGLSINEQKKKKAKKGEAWQQSFAFDEEYALINIQNAIRSYYNTDNHAQKVELREIINNNIRDYIINLRGCTPEIKEKIGKLPIPNDLFFLWHIYFKEVFDNGGFDIVIGNPPYIDSETMVANMPETRKLYASLYECAEGNWDMFVVFLEKALLLSKDNGVYSYIIPNKLLAAKYSDRLRTRLANTDIKEIRDYSRVPIFAEADVYPITIVGVKGHDYSSCNFVSMKDRINYESAITVDSQTFSGCEFWDVFYQPEDVVSVIKKCFRYPKLGTIDNVSVNGAATVNEAYRIKELLVDAQVLANSFKMVNTGTIDPYESYWGKVPMQYIKGQYLFPRISKNSLVSIFPTRAEQAQSNKIIVAGMSKSIEAIFDNGSCLAGKSTTIICHPDNDFLKMLLALLNSRLVVFIITTIFNSLKMSGGYINIGVREVSSVPVPYFKEEFKAQLIALVNRINDKLSDGNNDVKQEKDEIDDIIYKLFGLEGSEIALIEKYTTL